MTVCTICGLDGVLQLQGVWYCRDHAGDGAIEAVRLVTLWNRPQWAEEMADRTAGILTDAAVKVGREPRYWCSNCEEMRWTNDDCSYCGDSVYLKSEVEDEDEDEDEDDE